MKRIIAIIAGLSFVGMFFVMDFYETAVEGHFTNDVAEFVAYPILTILVLYFIWSVIDDLSSLD